MQNLTKLSLFRCFLLKCWMYYASTIIHYSKSSSKYTELLGWLLIVQDQGRVYSEINCLYCYQMIFVWCNI